MEFFIKEGGTGLGKKRSKGEGSGCMGPEGGPIEQLAWGMLRRTVLFALRGETKIWPI